MRNDSLQTLVRRSTCYCVQCFIWSGFSSQEEASAKVEIIWNGERVGGSSGYTKDYTFVQAPVVGTGSDKLAFVGGSAPVWTFIDDCKVYKPNALTCGAQKSPSLSFFGF
ncbi:hypothetical protein B0H14DRAFT_2557118 [Mycena olivaceomarginata]|nr:hypothetical protein B0H14DRAFT_2557118 [Mycena olivaceomarginata]